jgi:enoyl-CoA hydratase/carnithine racemase
VSGVRVERDGAVATIVIDRPERRNAFDSRMAAEFGAAVEELAGDREAAVVVVRGEGPVFCAGWDLDEIAAMRTWGADRVRESFERNQRMLSGFVDLPQPTIAVAQGAVAGFGFSLVARADIAIAGASTRFALPEVKHRVVPALVMLDLLGLPNRKLALRWLLSGATVDSAEAARGGLVSDVVADDELDAEAARQAGLLAELDGPTIIAAKALHRRLQGVPAAAAEAAAIETAVAALTS